MSRKITLFTLNLFLLIGHGFGDLQRHRRYLVNPNAGPSRAQFIFGLGVPVVLKEQALTIGSVIKMQYLVPVNSSEYTSRIYGLANTISRYMSGDNSQTLTADETKRLESATESDDYTEVTDSTLNDESKEIDNKNEEDEIVDNSNEENTLNNTESKKKRKRALYTEGGVINNEKGKKELSLEEAIRRQEDIDAKYQEKKPDRMNRWDFYKILERTAERYGYLGRPCLLRTICEAADIPFTYKNGLFGEIGHILFTPSTSDDELNHHSDNEYHAAERLGRDIGADCETLFPECGSSVLDSFTEIGMDTLHNFGFF